MTGEFDNQNSLPDLGDDVDIETFGQIYEMDEDDDHSFSLQIVEEFFEQANDTFREMDELLEKEDLVTLSERGHYLKGSSATLGLVKVKDSCEKIQRYGKMEDLDGSPVDDKEDCRKRLQRSLAQVKIECNRAERILKGFYDLPVPEKLEEDKKEEKKEEEEKINAAKLEAPKEETKNGEAAKANTKAEA